MLQSLGSSRATLDEMVRLEEELDAAIADLGTVDGHDVGSGEVNIFILTSHPLGVFETIKTVPRFVSLTTRLKVAYRRVGEDEFKILHPPGSSVFKIA